MNVIECLEHLAQTALADSRFVPAVRRTLSQLPTTYEPDEYLRARLHSRQIDLRTSLFVLAVTVGNFSVVLGYWLTPQ